MAPSTALIRGALRKSYRKNNHHWDQSLRVCQRCLLMKSLNGWHLKWVGLRVEDRFLADGKKRWEEQHHGALWCIWIKKKSPVRDSLLCWIVSPPSSCTWLSLLLSPSSGRSGICSLSISLGPTANVRQDWVLRTLRNNFSHARLRHRCSHLLKSRSWEYPYLQGSAWAVVGMMLCYWTW